MYHVGGGSALAAGGTLACAGRMDTTQALWVAVVLMIIGAVLIALGRRRRRREADMVGL